MLWIWVILGGCEHPELQDNSKLVLYGADDDYGAYWSVSPEFGCILFEE